MTTSPFRVGARLRGDSCRQPDSSRRSWSLAALALTIVLITSTWSADEKPAGPDGKQPASLENLLALVEAQQAEIYRQRDQIDAQQARIEEQRKRVEALDQLVQALKKQVEDQTGQPETDYVADLANEGGQDGVYDAVKETLEALPVQAYYAGYEHWWSSRLRSILTLGVVYVDNRAAQPDDAYHLTRRGSINLLWSPMPRFEIIGEFLTGVRINKDGERGRASQYQFGSTFRF